MKKLFCILIILTGCKDVYKPSLKNPATNYLVAEGNIVAGNDSTIIRLSRTTAIDDTNGINKPEINATIIVESEDGENYVLQNEFNGLYYAPPLNINQNKKYRTHIFTADGKEYASDYVPVKITPQIDSVSWKFDSTGGINIFVNTHDAANNAQYYRWEYAETWEHRAVDSSQLIYENDILGQRTHEKQIYRCWNFFTSSDILTDATTALSSDVIFEKKLTGIPYQSTKVRWYYSILVKQYALTKEAFEFWQNLKKNSEQIGSIFDPQPFAEFGNVHCISDTSEIAIGFINACSTTQQRLYIEYAQVHYPYIIPECKTIGIPISLSYKYFSGYPVDGFTWVPIKYGDAPGTVIGGEIGCYDCREQGGTNVKPPYMPR